MDITKEENEINTALGILSQQKTHNLKQPHSTVRRNPIPYLDFFKNKYTNPIQIDKQIQRPIVLYIVVCNLAWRI